MKTILSLLIGTVFLVIAGTPCCRGAAIKPDPAIQKDIDDVVVQLGGNIDSVEQAAALIQGRNNEGTG